MRRIALIFLLALGIGSRGLPADAQSTCSAPAAAADPLSVMIFSDFTCAYCDQVRPLIARLQAIYPGPMSVIFKHAPRTAAPDVWLMHEAALAADAQGRFWDMHDLIFAAHGRAGRAELDGFARQLELDMKAFSDDLDTHRFRSTITRDLAEARALWVTGTPAFYVNGVELVGVSAFAEFIKTLDSGASRAQPDQEPDVRDAPSVGPADAPVTVVSFADLRCGFCAETWPELAKVVAQENGRVRWVFKHFPLAIHDDAMLAHRAALAAGAQHHFWEMATMILNFPERVQRADLMRFARDLHLDTARFEADLDGAQSLADVNRDLAEGQRLGVRGTPTFFINGHMLVGAQSQAELSAAISEALKFRSEQPEKGTNLWLDLEKPDKGDGAGASAGR